MIEELATILRHLSSILASPTLKPPLAPLLHGYGLSSLTRFAVFIRFSTASLEEVLRMLGEAGVKDVVRTVLRRKIRELKERLG